MSVCCPACGAATPYLYGPTYRPRRWYRRRPYWMCGWCGYEWEDDE